MEEKQGTKPAVRSGKNKLAIVLIIVGVVIIILVIVGFLGSRYLWYKVKSTTETTPTPTASDESGRGGGGGLPSPSPSISGSISPTLSPGASPSSQSAAWPSDLPVDLPQYSGGTVSSSGKTENPGSYSIQITGSNQAEFDAYKNSLLTEGWTIVNPNDFRANNYRLQKTGVGWDLTILYNQNGVLITLMEQ